MRALRYRVHKEPPFYLAQCLDVDVSSFGETEESAVANMKEAVKLYFEDMQPAGSLDLILEERMSGPFEPLEPDWQDRVRKAASDLS